MRASLYAVKARGQWQAFVSLDMRADLLWWTGKYPMAAGAPEGAEELILLGKSLPLGQAVTWRDQFDSARGSRSGDSRSEDRTGGELKGKSDSKFEGRAWRFRAGEPGSSGERPDLTPVRLYVRGEGVHPQWAELCSPDRDGERGYAEAGHFPGPADVERFAALLAGRLLLQPELRGLLEDELPELAGSWRTLAQLAQLAGLAALTSGVAPPRGGRRRAAGLLRGPAKPRCRRCGSEVTRTAPCASCGQSSCAYCEACLALGRSRSCALLLQGSAGNPRAAYTAAARPAPTGQELDRWGLSPAQREAAAAALQFLAGASLSPRRPARPWHASRLRQAASSQLPASPCGPPSTKQSAPYRRSALHRSPAFPWRLNPWRPFRSERSAPHRHFSSSGRPAQPDLPAPSHPAAGRPGRFLLWAVTGAGKTEMIFPLLAYVLQAGGRALVATPRRDVVLELAPRLAKVFPEERMSVLYGGSEDRWKTGNLVLATTHQLLRFRGAFDLVIIDELDAFPYHNDPMLAYAAEACCKDKGHFIFLSATPPRRLQQDASAGRCGVARVPARFHGHPLPVPRRIQTPGTAESISRQRLPGILLSELQVSVRRGAQIFLFISRIQQIEPLLALLRRRLPGIPIEGTSSQDNQRSSKVLAFRSCQIRILVTTTILERGVTVPRSDVFILDADNGLFDEASLVQMAGRAGRSKEDPAGKVIFFSSQSTSAQRGAIRQINQMNRIAYRKGYLGAAKP